MCYIVTLSLVRYGPRALLDERHRPGGGGQVLLDVHRQARHLRELERGGAQQFSVSYLDKTFAPEQIW